MALYSEIESYIRQLKLLGDKDFVDVTRESLNQVAMTDKKRYIPQVAKKVFTVRKPSFFRAFTAVNFQRRGPSEIRFLESATGFMDKKQTKNMPAQETGETINRPFIPMLNSRIGKQYSKKVSKTKYINRPIDTLIRQSKMAGSMRKARMAVAIKTAMAIGETYIWMDEYNTIYRQKSGTKWVPVFYFYGKTHRYNLKASHLMEISRKLAMLELPQKFVDEAEKKINYRANKFRWKRL